MKHENSYDLLRILSIIAVIAIHVSASFLGSRTDNHLLTICLWNVMSRFAVPCFMMLSGALLLSNDKNKNYAFFYKKQFQRLGIPTLVFIFLYFIFNLVLSIATVMVKYREISRLWYPIKQILTGGYSHLWYMYAMAGVYVLVPVLLRVKADIGERTFAWVSWAFLALASIGYTTTGDSLLMWDVGFQFRFAGYFLAGYQIRRLIDGRKSSFKGILNILMGGGILTVVTLFRYKMELAGLGENDLSIPIVAALCPWIVIASLFIFAGFSFLNVRHDFSALASSTFFIYLIHAGVWKIPWIIIRLLGISSGDKRVLIPICIAAVFLISFIANFVWKGFYKKVQKSSKVEYYK